MGLDAPQVVGSCRSPSVFSEHPSQLPQGSRITAPEFNPHLNHLCPNDQELGLPLYSRLDTDLL